MSETVTTSSSGEHVVAATSELPPGSHKLVKIRGLEIGVYNVGGEYYAFHNMCPHQFGPACIGPVGPAALVDDEFQMHLLRGGEILTCPWHGMEFDLKTGQCLTRKDMHLRAFPVRVVDGNIHVQIRSQRAKT